MESRMAEDGDVPSQPVQDSNKDPETVNASPKHTKSLITTVEKDNIAKISTRSSSPAKRRASAMESESTGFRLEELSKGDQNSDLEDSNSPRSIYSPKKTTNSLPDRNIAANTLVDPPASRMEDGLPSLDNQVRSVMGLHAKEYEDNQRLYIISNKWLVRVLARTSEGRASGSYEKDALDGEIGPVDNGSIIAEIPAGSIKTLTGEPFISLKPDLRLGEDFEILPEEAWQLVMRWYGLAEGSAEIVRYAHDTCPEGAISKNIQCEVYPPLCTVRKLRNSSSGTTHQALREKNIIAPLISVSRNEYVQSFLKTLKNELNIEMNVKVRLWRILDQPQQELTTNGNSGMLTPATSRSGSPNTSSSGRSAPALIFEMSDFISMEEGTHRELIDVKDETTNLKYNGHLKLDTVGLAADQIIVVEEQSKNSAAEEYESDKTRKMAEENGISVTVTPNGPMSPYKGRDPNIAQRGQSSAASSGPLTRGRTRKDGRTRGTVGLVNLGNTCYMNSALQCIRSVEELSLYFLRQEYKIDYNANNPLGYGGAIAKAYAGLLTSIYGTNASSSFAPKNFKITLGRCQPIFSGYGQQDSQEFLSFLVDGLHEDLNRVIKKPYIENPESDDKTVNDPQAIRVLGDKFRANHRARNDSVAMDLFNGFYKNTMVCPSCDKVSITFDPFSLLTLQLPVESNWQHTVYFAPLRGYPVKVEVDMDKSSSIRHLKEYVAKRIPGLQPDKLVCAEVYSHKFFKTLTDDQNAQSNIGKQDEIMLYELDDVPSNFPPPKKKTSSKLRSTFGHYNSSAEDEIPGDDSPLADKMMVPLYHSIMEDQPARHRVIKLWPSFILLSREEAKDLDSILRKVLTKVATMTTKNIFEEEDDAYHDYTTHDSKYPRREPNGNSSTDPESQPYMRSLDGEDSVVDISMADTKGDDQDMPDFDSKSPTSEGKPVIKGILEPGGFIPPKFRRLFEMRCVKSATEMVPTALSQFDSSYRDYPLIRSRLPQLLSRRSSPRSDSTHQSVSSSSEDFDDVPEFSNNSRSGLNADTDSEDELVASSSPYGGCDVMAKKFLNLQKRKAAIEENKSQGKHVGGSEINDKPMLVHLGEAILLEWEPEGFNSLFGGNFQDNMRGRDTWNVMELLPDAKLEELRAKRTVRKKKGITLEDCFRETSKGEILSEENAWYCSRCKELRRASKTLEIWTVPDILVIHLKRFSSNRVLRDKVDVLVDFPTEGLDLTDRVGLHENKEMVYDLFAVSNHYGGLGGGHYTAFAQNFFDKKWYEYNDSSVCQRNKEAVVSSAAYLLFYRRRSDRPLGPPYLQKIVHEACEEISRSPDSSRTQSPAGEGQRLGGFSRNGSSGALVGAEAAHLPRGHGSVGETVETLVKNESEAAAVDFSGTSHNFPSYDEEDDDEGIGLNASPDYNNSTMTGPLYKQKTTRHQQGGEWDFSNVDRYVERTVSDDDFSDGTATDVAAPGSAVGDGLQDRIMTDFSTEDLEGRALRPNATTRQSSEEELPDLIGEDGTIRVNTEMGEDIDDPVAEVHVSESDEIKPE